MLNLIAYVQQQQQHTATPTQNRSIFTHRIGAVQIANFFTISKPNEKWSKVYRILTVNLDIGHFCLIRFSSKWI